ncbi:glutathione peroxidase [Amantichitinum ursilacus]|uniref:Glutathione peroxidase n=1 Tax=Amantichitinum ursilacus TaxID=857265 RepID=A0A0N0GLS4_9NEIS|nr:glutathione peroxidase [Amantichitinum ursilacus]KPC50280.1 Hydroperoxy fatty acid reductase gpx1 [Amantichitinum ursilacus]
MSASVYQIPVNKGDGTATSLAAYQGKVLLVVNVASQCGLTPQYEGLEKLYENKRADGLEVLAFPANNFGAQEPGTDAEIASFCSTNYNVQFPLFAKISVKGEDQHPLYSALVEAQPAAVNEGPMREKLKGYGFESDDKTAVLWNFEKFLISRDGQVVERFAPDVTPDDARLVAAIERELAR